MFKVSKLPYGKLGMDFLSKFQLSIDTVTKRLVEYWEAFRISPLGGDEDLQIKDEFRTFSPDLSNAVLLEALKTDFPEMFDEARRTREIKHFIVAAVETNTEIRVPIHFRARRLGPVKYRGLQVEIKRLVDQEIFEKSYSPWASPIVKVNKKNGNFRLCADFTSLNKTLKMKKYALPNINDFVSLASGCKIFSKLDIKDAYYNIPVRAEDRHKLSITTPLGNYCYKYLPIGLATSAAYYQQLMNEIISGLSQAYSYLDDIIVMIRTNKEHHQTLYYLMI